MNNVSNDMGKIIKRYDISFKFKVEHGLRYYTIRNMNTNLEKVFNITFWLGRFTNGCQSKC